MSHCLFAALWDTLSAYYDIFRLKKQQEGAENTRTENWLIAQKMACNPVVSVKNEKNIDILWGNVYYVPM